MIWLLPWEDNDEVRHMPWFTWALIAINVVVFVFQTALGDEEVARLFSRYGLIADEWHWYQFFTGSFLHGDWLHLLGNMLFLWVFGDNVEDALGHAGFLVVYFVGGFAGDLLYVYANDFQIPSIGASGCISALAGAYALLFFERDIDMKLMFLVFPVRTFSVGAFWAVLYFLGLDVARTIWSKGVLAEGDYVNYVAHGGGFLFGFAVAIVARLLGVMRRYHVVDNGGGWWGYWPSDLETLARKAAARRARMERTRQEWPK